VQDVTACACICSTYGDHNGECAKEATTEREGPMRVRMDLCGPCAAAWDRRSAQGSATG
jgi:hypothetical protein